MSNGPFETFADARTGMRQARVPGGDTLMMACAESGVALGRYDSRVLDELGSLESESVWVIASIIRRAGRSGE